MPDQALTGLKALEFGNLVSAPYCGKLMADMGAEVIKVEKPGLGDDARRREPFAGDTPGIERSGLFAYCNINKKSVTLNVRTATGRVIFKDLIKESDILLENNSPRLMEELDLTYEVLEKVNPGLIMTSITPFGQSGPYRDYKAYELTTYQGCGYGYISTATFQEPVLPPIKAGGRQSEFAAAQAAAVASMSALLARDEMGEGQQIDLSIFELMAGQNESAIQHWAFAENELGGVMHPILEPICPLPCKDGWIFLMCVEDHQYDKFIEMMGHPKWADNELFKDRFSRADHIDALWPLLSEWTEQHTREEVFTMAQAAHVPVGPAYTSEDVVNSSHLAERNYFVEIDHPVMGRAKYPGPPYILSETPCRIGSPAPLLGQHNQDIYCGRLGYTKQDLVKLAQTGVI
jgi:crotonobetainyl-CoA:carnitine CoA-transferase CaiB-like acyl-CoA transferase